MGRQQFEALKGVVRRSLLCRFHTSSVFHHRPAADGEVVLSEVSRRPASGSGGSLNPRFVLPNPYPRRALDSYFLLENASKIRSVLPSELDLRPSSGFLIPTYCSSRNSSASCVIASPALRLPSEIANQLYLSSPAGSRGLSSLVGDSKSADEGTVNGARECQGGDDGVSASVSGKEVPLKKRRKRKSFIQEIESGSAVKDNEGVTIAGNVCSQQKVETVDGSSSSDNVLPKPKATRKKRAKEISNENIVEAFSENVKVVGAMQRECGTFGSDSSNLTPVDAVYVDGEKPRVIIHSQQSSITNGSITVGRGLVVDEPVDSCKNRSSSGADLLSAARVPLDGSISRSSKMTEQVEETLLNQTENSSLDKVPAVSTAEKGSKGETSASNVIGAAAVALHENKQDVSSSVGVSDEDPHKFSDSQALYRSLLEAGGARPYQGNEKSKLNSIFYRFAASGWVSDQALSLYINSKFFPSAASRFRKFFMHKSSQELRSFLISKGPTNEALQFLFPVFAEFCIHEFPLEIGRYRELVNTADMTKPDAWYPFARAMRRKVVYHKGPTNSGKTYNALKRYREAASGIYCSPLRLLAMEVFDTVNMQGVYCNLHTGQEKKDVPFANHLSCTVEMCYLTQQWEVAVIDEIQMMGDEYRGWAWTRAFLGLQADEIHVCGDPSALPLIRNLCNGTGDELVEYEYERFKPLKVATESLRGDFRNIEAGDCIVAFSRRDIFDIKREVELASKHHCCVVYGALPPETRTQQAKLFNEVDNGYNVLVASDAIGMGLNLNIKRVVFFSLDKFDGDSKKPVPPAQVKQIAGRAGRRGSLYPEGVTTTFFSQDLPYLGSSMLQDFEPATAAGLFPVYEQVELFASQLPNETFAKLLERFSETCRLDGSFFLCRYDNLKRVANMLEKVKGLSLEDRFNFCFAPVNVRDPQSMGALYRYATAFSQKIPVHVEMGVPSNSARDEFELLDLEARHQVLSMYLWLSQHFPGDLFPQKEQAGEMASQIAVLLGQSLVQSSRRWAKRKLSQHRGRPFMDTGRPDSKRTNEWRDGKSKPLENFVRA